MDSWESASQPYILYQNSQWTEDSKPPFVGDVNEHQLDDKGLGSVNSTGPSASGLDSRRQSMLKTEDEFSASGQMWHDRSHEHHNQIRHFSHPQVSMMNGHRPQHPTFTNSFHHPHPHQWPVSHSGSSTPTPVYGAVDPYGQPISYGPAPPAYTGYSQDPVSAVSMSPQSSQGGWGSTTSSDGADQRGLVQSPTYRPASPTTVLRSDGIRKKNARFEIPKERNLANIDAMIQASTDESEKKELKQQKRLLRNRQAALDSRQRKKTHTEKLEQEKKISEKKMYDLEEACARLEGQLSLEREQWLQQRQHYEHAIHTLQFDRDEAIRTKTLETGELRRQNNILKDCVRDLERQQSKGYAPATELNPFGGEFNDFGIEQHNWNDEFCLINEEDFGMEEHEHIQRHATPKPSTGTPSTIESKSDSGFSWNTFYMCLLFGAFVAANSNGSTATNGTTSAIASSISPSEAGNVLKAVLQSKSELSHEVVPTPSRSNTAERAGSRSIQTSAMELGHMATPTSTLDNLHQTLSTPSRRQEIAAAFSLSTASYNHITDPFNEHLNDDADAHDIDPPKPSQLQQAFAAMQAEKNEMERITGFGSKARERSLLWDQIPPQVVKDFEELVRNSGGLSNGENEDKMER